MMRLRMVPTMSVRYSERAGTPSETAHRHASFQRETEGTVRTPSSHLRRADEGRQFCERAHFAVRSPRQALAALVVPVAPNDLHPEGRGSICIPCIRRLKGDGRCRNAEAIDGETIDFRMRLVDADQLDRQNVVEQSIEQRLQREIQGVACDLPKIRVFKPAFFSADNTVGTSGNVSSRRSFPMAHHECSMRR